MEAGQAVYQHDLVFWSLQIFHSNSDCFRSVTECSVTYELAFPCHCFRSMMRPGFTGSLKSVFKGFPAPDLPGTYKQLILPPAAPTELFCFLVPFQVPCELHSCSPPASPTHPYGAQSATMRSPMLCLLSHLLYHSLSQEHCICLY